MNDYWSTITEGKSLYQMGAQSHRVYLLNRLKELGVKELLDVGCGTGPLYELITKTTKRGYMTNKFAQGEEPMWEFLYKGTDPSESMIETCKHHFPDGKFEVQSAERMAEKDNSWESVIYMHSFDYIYDYLKALKEAHRVTRRYVAIILWQPMQMGAQTTHNLNNSINGQEQVDWTTARLQHFSWPQLLKEAEDVGFRPLEMKTDSEINKEGKHNTFLLFEKI